MSVRGMFFFAGALARPVRRQYAESGMETRVNLRAGSLFSSGEKTLKNTCADASNISLVSKHA